MTSPMANPTPPGHPGAAIDITPSYLVLAFILAFFKPQASIDGSAPFPVRWGPNLIPVPPGRHQVEVWVPYLFLTRMGRNGAIVDVPPGGVVQVTWRAPWLVFFQGKIGVAGPFPLGGAAAAPLAAPPSLAPATAAAAATPAPATAGPAGWHPDPAGRHEQRYYDGSTWTEHVVDAGTQTTDPLGG
ncbi:MAG TPA: DUF2510 domain-containing protein [Aquihabitans sp.]|jgi:hypothetical protein|nr:DUF2510 domain-containing protein [Aquihabitans sp.]